MSNHNANINEKLRRWLRGDANIHDERELDRHAQNDPFLAEAMEGYRNQIAGDHAKRTARLQQKIRSRSRGKTTVPYWRVAAMVLSLVVAGTVLYQIEEVDHKVLAERNPAPLENEQAAPAIAEQVERSDAEAPSATSRETDQLSPSPAAPQRDQTLAENQARARQAPPPLPSAKMEVESQDDLMLEEAQNEMILANVAQDKDDEAKESKHDQVSKDSELAAEKPIVTEGVRANQAPPAVALEDRSKKRRELPGNSRFLDTNRSDVASATAAPAEESGKRIIYGKILDVMGEPIIGASVSITDVKLSSNTDVKGEFELLVDSNEHVLQIDYVGYNSLRIDVPAGGNISERFTLDDESLSVDQLQIAVTGLSQTRTKRLEPIAYPEGGRAGFKQHVKDNAARGLPKGRVRLRFKIGSDGRPYNIRVERSNNPVLNSSAMYLLQTGPNWLIVQGIAPIDMQFTVRFR